MPARRIPRLPTTGRVDEGGASLDHVFLGLQCHGLGYQSVAVPSAFDAKTA